MKQNSTQESGKHDVKWHHSKRVSSDNLLTYKNKQENLKSKNEKHDEEDSTLVRSNNLVLQSINLQESTES